VNEEKRRRMGALCCVHSSFEFSDEKNTVPLIEKEKEGQVDLNIGDFLVVQDKYCDRHIARVTGVNETGIHVTFPGYHNTEDEVVVIKKVINKQCTLESLPSLFPEKKQVCESSSEIDDLLVEQATITLLQLLSKSQPVTTRLDGMLGFSLFIKNGHRTLVEQQANHFLEDIQCQFRIQLFSVNHESRTRIQKLIPGIKNGHWTNAHQFNGSSYVVVKFIN
jgi:hypothetical protein